MGQTELEPHYDRQRDPAGLIGRKYGAVPVSVLRRAYGEEFALGVPGWKTLGQVLQTLDEPSLARLVWDTPGA